MQENNQRKRLVERKWNIERAEDSQQEYKEVQRKSKREVANAKQKGIQLMSHTMKIC